MFSRLSQTVKGEIVLIKHVNSHFTLSPSMVFWRSAIQARKSLSHSDDKLLPKNKELNLFPISVKKKKH